MTGTRRTEKPKRAAESYATEHARLREMLLQQNAPEGTTPNDWATMLRRARARIRYLEKLQEHNIDIACSVPVAEETWESKPPRPNPHHGLCRCSRCASRRWPSIYVSSRGVAYECVIERAPIDEDFPQPPSSPGVVVNRAAVRAAHRRGEEYRR